MKVNSYRRLQTILMSLVLSVPLLVSASQVEQSSVERLLEMGGFHRKMDRVVESAVEMASKLVPGAESYKEELFLFYDQNLKGDAFRQRVIDLYTRLFTEEEIQAILAFFETDAGQSYLNKQPAFEEELVDIIQDQLLQNIKDLELFLIQKLHGLAELQKKDA